LGDSPFLDARVRPPHEVSGPLADRKMKITMIIINNLTFVGNAVGELAKRTGQLTIVCSREIDLLMASSGGLSIALSRNGVT